MNPRSLALRFAATAALSTLATVAQAQEPQRVAVKTAGLTPFVAKAVEEKASLGVDELRRYVERTRMVHGLYIPDLVREDEPAIEQAKAPADDEAPVVAKRQQAPSATMTAAKAPKTQVAKNAKAPSTQLAKNAKAPATQLASAKAAKPGTDTKPAAGTKLALAGQKTKRA